jgi:hypothetical protein
MNRRTLGGISIVLMLAGCGGGDNATAEPTTVAEASSPAAVPGQPLDGPAMLAAGFPAEARAAAPRITEGHTDKAVANAGAHLCQYLAEDGMTGEILTKRMASTFGDPAPTLDEIRAFAAVAVAKGCPNQAGQLAALT